MSSCLECGSNENVQRETSRLCESCHLKAARKLHTMVIEQLIKENRFGGSHVASAAHNDFVAKQ